MNRDETRALLIARRELTNDAFSDGTIEMWHAALAPWTLAENRAALISAAREHPRVSVSHLIARLPQRTPAAPELPPLHCQLCDDTGWRATPQERAHRPNVCNGDPCYCTAVEPCSCSTGIRNREIADRVRDFNDRALARHRHPSTPPPWTEQELPL